jgi:hypothetical protein
MSWPSVSGTRTSTGIRISTSRWSRLLHPPAPLLALKATSAPRPRRRPTRPSITCFIVSTRTMWPLLCSPVPSTSTFWDSRWKVLVVFRNSRVRARQTAKCNRGVHTAAGTFCQSSPPFQQPTFQFFGVFRNTFHFLFFFRPVRLASFSLLYFFVQRILRSPREATHCFILRHMEHAMAT